MTVRDDGGTAFGGADTITRTFTVNVTAVPDAPAIDTSLVPMLPAVPLKPAPTNPAGPPVADLLAGVTEADGDPLGLAITGIDNRKGAWQFSIERRGDVECLFRRASRRRRHWCCRTTADPRAVPADRGFQGLANLSFRAWDRSDGAVEGTPVDSTLAPTATAPGPSGPGWPSARPARS